MSKCEFRVGIEPMEAFNLVKQEQSAELLEEDFKDLGDGKQIGVLVFEKFFFRTNSRASLVVIIDNINGYTNVNAIGSGGGNGMIFKFDWGASDDFASGVKDILRDYLIE